MKETRKKLLKEIEALNSTHVASKRHRQSRYLSSKERGLAEKKFNLSNPVITCMQLLNFYLKYEGRRPATECVPTYRKKTRYICLNMFPNIVSFKFCEDGHLEKNQTIRYYIWWRHWLSSDAEDESAKIVETVFRVMREITCSLDSAVDLYNGFCDWLVQDLCDRYLPQGFKRIVLTHRDIDVTREGA